MFTNEPPLWRKILRANYTNLEKLAQFLELTKEQKSLLLAKPPFILNVPARLANKIKKGTLEDPILRQFVPLAEEAVISPGFKSDPVGDVVFRKTPKLLKKYQGRALLLCTSACAMHCRYCFRQNFDYSNEGSLFQQELELIHNDKTISEIILSGGDPLSFSDEILGSLLEKMCSIAHVKRIRFHTRFPIGIPERIDNSLLAIFKKAAESKQIWMAVHVNHPSELDSEVLDSLKKLRLLGVVLINQSVLLKGVNDDYEVLKQLSELLVDNGILPYYLHQLDRIQGGAHFEVEEEKGLQLIGQLACSLSGYAVPKYVKEIEGEQSKTAIL